LAFSVQLSDPDNTPLADGEPTRLRLRVAGYGPKGALKKLELVIKRTNFDYDPVAAIMMRSSEDGTPINFSIGESAAKDYSGHDNGGTSTILPAFGSNTAADTAIQFRNGGGNGDIFGAITVSRFSPTGSGGFLAPSFYTNGGGNGVIQYDSVAVRKGLNISGPLVSGVREY